MTVEEIQALINSFGNITKGSDAAAAALETLKQKYQQAMAEQRAFGASMKDLGDTTNFTADKLADISAKKAEYARITDILAGKINELGGSVQSLNLGTLQTDLNNVTKSLNLGNTEMGHFSSTLISRLGQAVKDNAGLLAVWGSGFARNIVNPAKEWNPVSTSAAFKGLNDLLKDMLTTQATARRAFIALGDSVGDANRKTTQYLMDLRTTQAALGMTKADQKAFNESVVVVPGILERASDALLKTVNMQGQMVQTSGILQTALQRFRMTGTEAGAAVQNAFLATGLSTSQFAEYLGEANAALRGTDIDAKTALQQMLNANTVMGIFGDQASRTTTVWHQFATTLRSSGVAANQVGEIVNSVTRNLATMSVQNRAFITMMSGMFQGATALGGALRMELAMRGPGGLEQNLEALTTSLARFGGGQVITLQQAANNPQLEMQFVLQRQMLGKLAGITNTEQQNRILEVLQGVQQGGISRLEGSRELKDVMNKGRNIQEQLVTSLERQEQIMQTGFVRAANLLGNIDKKLEGFNRVLGIGRLAARGEEPIERAGVGRAARAISAESAADFRQQLREGLRLMGVEGRNVLMPGPGTPIAPAGLRGERLRGALAEPALGTGMLRAFGSGLRAFISELTGVGNVIQHRNIEATRLPAMPGRALVPGGAGVFAPVPTAVMPERPTAGLNIAGATMAQINRMAAAERTRMPPGTTGMLRATVPAAGPGPVREPGAAAAGAVITNKTESTITIKIDSDQPKFRKFVVDILEKEIPKFVNGEDHPER